MRVLGLDIGGTKCAVTACEAEKGKISVLDKKVFVTDTSIPGEEMIKGYYSVMKEYKEKYDCDDSSSDHRFDMETVLECHCNIVSGWTCYEERNTDRSK